MQSRKPRPALAHAKARSAIPAARSKSAAWSKAAPIVLAADATVDEAIVAIATACRDHWQANTAAAIAGEHPEGVHQVRVGLRRFRVFLTLFAETLPSDQRLWLKAEAKAMADALGVARDMDVFLMELMEPVMAESAHDADLAVLLRAARDARNATHATAAAALTSKRHQRFVARLNTWLSGRGWRVGGSASGGPAQDFAREMLNARLAKLAARAKTIKQMSSTELHELRIAVKKLRYGLEFFQSLLPPKRSVRIGRLLKELQDSLGSMNDLEVAQRTLRRLSAGAASPAARTAISRAGHRVTESFEANVENTRPQAARAATRLRACKTL